jgi:C-terminal processing protease CtpA/Prc
MNLTKKLLATALACALSLPTLAAAQSTAANPAPVAAKELEQKRAELERAEQDLGESRRKVIELRRELGDDAPRTNREQRREVRIVTAADHAMIGVVFGEDSGGVYVRAVTPGGGADKAGVRAGDRLLAVNGKDVAAGVKAAAGQSAIQTARGLVGRPKEGEQVRLSISRDGKRQELVATAAKTSVFEWSGNGEIPPRLRERLRRLEGLEGLEGRDVDVLVERALERAGRSHDMAGKRVMMFRESAHDLRFAAINPELGKFFGATSGVLVLEQKNQRFAPLATGDVITSLGGEKVESPADVIRAMRRHEPGKTVNVEVVRDRKRQVLVLTVPERPNFEALWPEPPVPPAPAAAPPAPPAPPAPANANAMPPPATIAPAAVDTLEV